MSALVPYHYSNREEFNAFCMKVSQWSSQEDLEIQLAAEENGQAFYTIDARKATNSKRKREEYTAEEISLFAQKLLFEANENYLSLIPEELLKKVTNRILFVSDFDRATHEYLCDSDIFNYKRRIEWIQLTQELMNERERNRQNLEELTKKEQELKREFFMLTSAPSGEVQKEQSKFEQDFMKEFGLLNEAASDSLQLLQQDETLRNLTFVTQQGKIKVHSFIFKGIPFINSWLNAHDAIDREISLEKYSHEAVQYFVCYSYKLKEHRKMTFPLIIEIENLSFFLDDKDLLARSKSMIMKCQKLPVVYNSICADLLATQVVDPRSQVYLKLPPDQRLLKNVLLGNLNAICTAKEVDFENELECWIKFSKEQNLDILVTAYFDTKSDDDKMRVLDQLRSSDKINGEEFQSIYRKLEDRLCHLKIKPL